MFINNFNKLNINFVRKMRINFYNWSIFFNI